MRFLIKEIRSKKGVLHFRRYRLLSTPWFNVYLHKLYESDRDDYHDHPWPYLSIVLWGKYAELTPDCRSRVRTIGNCGLYPATHAHKIVILKPATTLVITGQETRPLWGYVTKDGWVDHLKYRKTDVPIKDYD